jgi:hypothetical protein
MQLSKQTRFEQIPLAVVFEIAKEQAKRPKSKVAKKIEKQDRGTK